MATPKHIQTLKRKGFLETKINKKITGRTCKYKNSLYGSPLMCTAHYTIHNKYNTLHTKHYTLYSKNSIFQTAHYTQNLYSSFLCHLLYRLN